MHGADHDVLWLQRDFGLYLVNLFDTGQARCEKREREERGERGEKRERRDRERRQEREREETERCVKREEREICQVSTLAAVFLYLCVCVDFAFLPVCVRLSLCVCV